MGHRTVKRVPMDFDWPHKEVWAGYLLPEFLREQPCPQCDGGYSPEYEKLNAKWYGRAPFDPAETGSERLTPQTPAVRAFAQNNIERSPEFYGRGDDAIEREARRLADHWNGQWCHHLEQVDVDALIAGGRLYDLTHTWTKGEGWKPRDPMPTITAADVNTWSLKGFGHDSINSWIVIKAKCARLGVSETCSACDGQGTKERWGGQRAAADAWSAMEPPKGDGWQLWETTTEGSPTSPVFATASELADWCADNATAFADMRLTAEQWLHSFEADSTDIDTMLVATVPE